MPPSGTPHKRTAPPSTVNPPAGVADDAIDSNAAGVTTIADGSESAVLRSVIALSAARLWVSAPLAWVWPASVLIWASSAVSSACLASCVSLMSTSVRSSVASSSDRRVTGMKLAYVFAAPRR